MTSRSGSTPSDPQDQKEPVGRGPRRWLRPGTNAWRLPAGATRPQQVVGPLPGPAAPAPVDPVDPAEEPTVGLRLHRDARTEQPTPPAPDQDPPATNGSPSTRRTPRWLAAVREVVVVVVIAMLLSFVIKTFLLQPFWIPSQSMEPALVPGDRVVVSKLTPGPFALHRGDVVVFEDPDHWLGDDGVSPHVGPARKLLEFVGLYPAGDDHLIKRVIGMPGDHVKCCDSSGRITINGTSITEPYLAAGTKPSLTPFDITVPAGRIWVMGDNRGNSGDSRYHDNGTGATGSVPIRDVTGRADAILWPLDRITWLGNYSATFAKVPSP